MATCPVCKAELDDSADSCSVCGYEFEVEASSEWVALGTIDDKISADFARETLKDMNIPAVILSKSGFFGDVGLPLNPFYKPGEAMFEVSVPRGFEEEAGDALDMTLGTKWRRKGK